MRCTLSIISCILLVLQQLVSGQQCTVGRVGSTRTGTMGNRAANEFYIDRGNRAGCAGMITSLSYCFHRPPGNLPAANEYLTTVAVYRPASTNANENVFTAVSSPITIQKPVVEFQTELNTATDTNFACSVFNLPQPVPMATGDVLGACVFDSPDTTSGVTTYRLDIVSRAASDSEDLVRTNTDPSSPVGCSATTVPSSFDGGASGTGSSSSRSLHLWANIEVVTTEAPTMGATTMEATTMEATTMEATTMEATTMETTTMEATTMEATTMEVTTMETTTMEATTMEVTTMEATTMEATTMEATTMETTTMEATMEATTMEATKPSTTTPEQTANTNTPEDGTTDMTTAGGPLMTEGDSTTATTNRGTTSNPDATTAQPIGGGGGGSNVATIAIAVVVVLIVVIALVAILILVLLRRRSKALHSIKNNEVHDKSGKETAVDLKSNEAYGIHGQSSTTQQPNDVTYEEVPGPIHYNDPCQPIPLENIEAYRVHKSAQMAETCSQEVDLKSNEAYGVRGEVQVAAINGTTDAVYYSVIDSPGQQSGEAARRTKIQMDSNEAYGTSERDRQTEETLDYDYAIL